MPPTRPAAPSRSFQLPPNVAGNAPSSSGGILLPQASDLKPASNPDDISLTRPLADPVHVPKTERSLPPITRPVRFQVARSQARNILPILGDGSPVKAKFSSQRVCTYLCRQTDRQPPIQGSQPRSPAPQTSVNSSMPAIVSIFRADIEHNILTICFFSRIHIVRRGSSTVLLPSPAQSEATGEDARFTF